MFRQGFERKIANCIDPDENELSYLGQQCLQRFLILAP